MSRDQLETKIKRRGSKFVEQESQKSEDDYV